MKVQVLPPMEIGPKNASGRPVDAWQISKWTWALQKDQPVRSRSDLHLLIRSLWVFQNFTLTPDPLYMGCGAADWRFQAKFA